MSTESTPAPEALTGGAAAGTVQASPVPGASPQDQKQIQFFAADSNQANGIEVGGGFSCSDLSMRRLLVMAAVSPEGLSLIHI